MRAPSCELSKRSPQSLRWNAAGGNRFRRGGGREIPLGVGVSSLAIWAPAALRRNRPAPLQPSGMRIMRPMRTVRRFSNSFLFQWLELFARRFWCDCVPKCPIATWPSTRRLPARLPSSAPRSDSPVLLCRPAVPATPRPEGRCGNIRLERKRD